MRVAILVLPPRNSRMGPVLERMLATMRLKAISEFLLRWEANLTLSLLQKVRLPSTTVVEIENTRTEAI